MKKAPFNIMDYFYIAAQKYPNRIAIIEKNKEISFSKLEKEVEITVSYFQSKGIKKGDRVLIFVPMSIDLYRIVMALFSIGAIAVFLDEWVSRRRMEICCQLANCKAFIGIFNAHIYAYLSPELRKIPIKLGTGYRLLSTEASTKEGVFSEDTALITFTTGSTGIPKAAKRTHGFLNEQFKALLEKMNPVPDDVDMPVLPVPLLINLGIGCTSVIAEFKSRKPESMNAKKIVDQINKYNVSRIVASPFFIKQLSHFLLKEKISTPSIKNIFTGGAPVFPVECALYNQAFPDANIEVLYGSTEAEPISSINTKQVKLQESMDVSQGLFVGIPYQGAKVKIIQLKSGIISCRNEQELEEITLPEGEIGEIIVSGHHVLREYFNNNEAIKQNKIFISETCWHRTGDSGYLDKNGGLFLTGRCNTLIERNKELLAPFMFEDFFSRFPEIEMGTIMMIDQQLNAIIELKSKDDVAKTRQKIENSTPIFEKIIFIKKMPRDPRHHSKIDYDVLRESLRKARNN